MRHFIDNNNVYKITNDYDQEILSIELSKVEKVDSLPDCYTDQIILKTRNEVFAGPVDLLFFDTNASNN